MTSNNRSTIITGCAPSPNCQTCQEGRKRLRYRERNGLTTVVKFEHVGKQDGLWSLVLCQDQTAPEADLTQRF